MANRKHLTILKQGRDVWNAWTSEIPSADYGFEKLPRGTFEGYAGKWPDLFRADLGGMDLTGYNLDTAILFGANLSNAILVKTGLVSSILTEADLTGANLDRAQLGFTVFGNTDLSKVKGLETVIHRGPSHIDIATIYCSKGQIPEIFLRGCGVPENFITFKDSLTGKAFEYYSCFISHSTKDKSFCERIYADLQAKGVRAWYFPEDAKWGESLWGEIDRGIKIYDKLVVILSEHSLQSGPVLREIERALSREDKEDKNILFPITIDNYLFEMWEHPRRADILAKVVGTGFVGWDKDAKQYERAFGKLLKGLKAES